MPENDPGPWICHVCDGKFTGPSIACAHCFKVTCARHLRHVPVRNRETGLYELQPVCLACALSEGQA